jgi:uncharacterized membrane protein
VKVRTILILKTITWRLSSFISSILITLWVTGSQSLAIKVGVAEFIIKTVLYWVHEKIWYTKLKKALKQKFKTKYKKKYSGNSSNISGDNKI